MLKPEDFTADLTPREVVFKYRGEQVTIKVRPLSWTKKNQIVSRSVYYDNNKSNFDLDRYYKDCLMEMIVEAPWGKTNMVFLSQVPDDLGLILQKLVPVPMPEDNEECDFFGKESDQS